jgi:hypothetical protein
MVFPFGFSGNPDTGTASLFSTIYRGNDVGRTPIPTQALTGDLMSHFCNEAPKSGAAKGPELPRRALGARPVKVAGFILHIG